VIGLDKLWMKQNVKCDFTADLTRTGDRSEYEKICETVFYIVCYVSSTPASVKSR